MYVLYYVLNIIVGTVGNITDDVTKKLNFLISNADDPRPG